MTGVGAAALAVILVVGYLVQSARDTTGAPATAPAGSVGSALAVGRTSAPVTVSVYEDFLCPYCGDLEGATRGWLHEYVAQGKVEVRYHVISILDRRSEGADYSTRSANALAVVLDASGPEVAWRFHDLLFENQPEEETRGLSDGSLVRLAVRAGAAEAAVEQGITERSFEQWVVNATDAATKEEGFQGTPYVQLDGKPFTGYQTMDELSTNLREAVDAAEG